jgi:tetratricopeptide (TPR) repeat protein
MSPMPGWLRTVALILALAGTAATTRLALEPIASARKPLRELAFLPDGRTLRAVSLGQRHTLADYYWLSLVQHVGVASEAKAPRWDAVFPVANLVTDLDPRYGYAYQEAGGVLSGLAKRTDLSNRLLEKGIAAVPDRWQLHWNLAYNKYFYENDKRTAAHHLKLAAEVGQRPHLYYQAAALAMDSSGADDYDFAIHILEVALAEAESEPLRQVIAERLVRAYTDRALAAVERAVEAFRLRHGRPPASLEELVAARLLPAVPPDPAGGRIEYDPKSGVPRSTVLGARQPILKGPIE